MSTKQNRKIVFKLILNGWYWIHFSERLKSINDGIRLTFQFVNMVYYWATYFLPWVSTAWMKKYRAGTLKDALSPGPQMRDFVVLGATSPERTQLGSIPRMATVDTITNRVSDFKSPSASISPPFESPTAIALIPVVPRHVGRSDFWSINFKLSPGCKQTAHVRSHAAGCVNLWITSRLGGGNYKLQTYPSVEMNVQCKYL